MKKVLNILRYIFLVIIATVFVLSLPLFSIYRVSHEKTTNSKLWVNLFFKADFTNLMLNHIPDEQRKKIEENVDFLREKQKINDFIKESLIEKKFTPFINNVIDYLLMRKNTKPLPISLQREKNQLYFHFINLYGARVNAIPLQFRRQGEANLKAVFSRFFPDTLTAEKFFTPELKRDINKKREQLQRFDSNSKYAFYIPLLMAVLIILLAMRPKKIFAWLGFSLALSSIFFIAYSFILFFGLNPSLYIYEQLKGMGDFRAFFNDTVLPYTDFRSVFHAQIFRPIIIETIICFVIGVIFIILSFVMKTGNDTRADASVEVIQ